MSTAMRATVSQGHDAIVAQMTDVFVAEALPDSYFPQAD